MVGYTNAFQGSNFQFYNKFARRPDNSGGAINGYMTKDVYGKDKDSENFVNIRQVLKKSWNTTYPSQLRRSNLNTKKTITTPFRAINNAGDLMDRKDYMCVANSSQSSNQGYQSRTNIYGLKQRFGCRAGSCMPSVIYNDLQKDKSIPAANCNVRYVYDTSDYIKYKKQLATNRNFNDYSYGGDNHYSGQSAIKAIRH